jgi:hypothetical protein
MGVAELREAIDCHLILQPRLGCLLDSPQVFWSVVYWVRQGDIRLREYPNALPEAGVRG